MKIAIHHRKGSYSERWISICKTRGIPYKLVDCYDNNIINDMCDCDALLWHHHHAFYKDALFAKSLTYSLERAGKVVFPNFESVWHFDDKVGQKYLLESVGASLVPSYVFYDRDSALKWAKETSYPKVFKLKGGAGSLNVKLVRNYGESKNLIRKAFGKGFAQYDKIEGLKEHYRRFKKSNNIYEIIKGFGKLVLTPEFSKMMPREKGYVYFQEFIENDGFDVRVVVIDGKAVALKRLVRENDFRASGSGNLIFEKEHIDKRYIREAFMLASKLCTQSLAVDFIRSKKDEIFTVEISYGFPMLNFLDDAGGFWDEEIVWHEDDFNLQEWMIEVVLKNLEALKKN